MRYFFNFSFSLDSYICLNDKDVLTFLKAI
jgi:hypothetical protein